MNVYNDDPARPGQGVPVGMTVISERLAGRGYIPHFIGKVLHRYRPQAPHPPRLPFIPLPPSPCRRKHACFFSSAEGAHNAALLAVHTTPRAVARRHGNPRPDTARSRFQDLTRLLPLLQRLLHPACARSRLLPSQPARPFVSSPCPVALLKHPCQSTFPPLVLREGRALA